MSQPWNSGLLDCFSDPKSCCCLTYWCPCVTFGRIVEIADKGSTSCCGSGSAYVLVALVFGCPFLLSFRYRSKLRLQYSLKGSCCSDFLVHCFCEPCALCQEYRELQSRGFNMSIGWQENMDAKNKEVAMGSVPPVVEGGMSRNK